MFGRSAGSLEYRLAGAVSLGLLLFAVLMAGVSFYFDYRAQIAASADIQRQLVRTVQTQAEVAAFVNNAEIAADVLNGLMTNETVASVQLTAINGFSRELHRSLPNGSQLVGASYVLYSPVDKTATIGELQLSADETVVRKQAIRSAAINVMWQLLEIVLTAVLLAMVFRRVVTRPIAQLASELSTMQPGSSDRVVIAQTHANDEIGVLSFSANSLLDAAENAINRERELRFKVEEMEQHYRHIFETSTIGIMVLQLDGRLINSNPVLLEKIIGSHANGQSAVECEDFIAAIFAQPELAWAMVGEASACDREVSADLQLKTDDGQIRWVHCILSVNRDHHGAMEIIEGVVYDVTARRAQEEAAHQRAEIDMLTGLRNRHGCELFINRLLRHASEDNLAVGILMVDLDGFKAVNDQFGHAAGDQVLVEVASRLRENMRRSNDLVARLGGDEFVVVADNCGEDRALLARIAREIVASLARPITLASGDLACVSASVGVAYFPQDGASYESLLRAADLALYQVKRGGKNGYAFSTELPSPTSTGTQAAAS